MKKKRINKVALRDYFVKLGLMFVGAGVVSAFSTRFDGFIWSSGLVILGSFFSYLGLLEEKDNVTS